MPRCHCCHDILEKYIRKKQSSYHDSLHPCAEAHCVRIYSFWPSRSTHHPHLPCFLLRAMDLYLTAGGTLKREAWLGIRCRGERSARCLFLWSPPSVFLQGGSFARSETLSTSLLDSHLLGSDHCCLPSDLGVLIALCGKCLVPALLSWSLSLY